MQMHFVESNNVTLLFDFWNVSGPGGMALSVLVVLLLTVIYELLKVWKIILEKRSRPLSDSPAPVLSPALNRPGSSSSLSNFPSDSSLFPTGNTVSVFTPAVNRWLLHCLKTGIHIMQVTLGYMLMLCVMSYNVWIFLGVIFGSVLGFFLAFPLIGHVK